MKYLAGFQPRDFVVLEILVLLIPIGAGILFLYNSRRSPADSSVNKTSLLVAGAILLTLLILLEMVLFNGERLNISLGLASAIRGYFWTGLFFGVPIIWLICRYALRNYSTTRLLKLRKRSLQFLGILGIGIGLSLAAASSCLGFG